MINTIEHRITILIIVARIGMTLNTPEMFGSISGDEFYIRQEQTQVVPMICPLLREVIVLRPISLMERLQ